jgi:hypothetical protein
MIVRNRRPIRTRTRSGERIRPESIDFPQIRKEVKLYNEVGVILKEADVFRANCKPAIRPVELD